MSASASASRLATPKRRGGTQRTPGARGITQREGGAVERKGGTQREGERYSAALAAATLSGVASPAAAAATRRWVLAREGEATPKRTLGLTLTHTPTSPQP